ncbi:RNA-directed DNA polymerase, eukaryota [Tanacetum coccineum]
MVRSALRLFVIVTKYEVLQYLSLVSVHFEVLKNVVGAKSKAKVIFIEKSPTKNEDRENGEKVKENAELMETIMENNQFAEHVPFHADILVIKQIIGLFGLTSSQQRYPIPPEALAERHDYKLNISTSVKLNNPDRRENSANSFELFPFCPTEEFQFGKGLKQGDPLSLFLFILIMESLHLSVQRVVDEGMFHGINLGGVVNLSHMFYADDAVFVRQWSESNISTLVHVLECFHRVSGLKINMSKSKIMGIHVDNVNVSRAANKLGCLVLKTPFLYLGSFVGRAMHQLQAWNDIVDRVRRRLSKWKIKMLSIG